MKKLKRFRNWIALVAAVSWNYLQQLATVKPWVAEDSPDNATSQASSSASVSTEPESKPVTKPITAPVIASKPAPRPQPQPVQTARPVAKNVAPPKATPPPSKPVEVVVKAPVVHTSAKAPSVPAPAKPAPANGKSSMNEQSAQRLARVLISEIKLYYMSKMEGQNEADMQTNIYDLLKDPIDKSRQHYKQRVGAETSLPDYFHGELVKTLCAGDESRLGPNYTTK